MPTQIQDYDGFDVTNLDTNRWETPVQSGSTTMEQTGGELVFTNLGTGTKGISYYETKRKFGKNWRKSIDLKLATITGTSGEISLVLYKDANNYVKIGPYKSATVDCNCYLRYRVAGGVAQAQPLTADVINTTEFSTYTFGIIGDTILIYYDGILMTSMPFGEMFNFTARIEAGTGANADTLSAKANDYETINHLDTMLITIGAIVKDIHDNMGVSLVNDISGNITLTNTTEQFITLSQATYGTKFRVHLFADLEGQLIDVAGRTPNGGAFEDLTAIANNLVSNSVPLVGDTPAAGDCFYFKSLTQFHSLDLYMEKGAGNTSHTIIWEYWNGSAWATLTVTDGTIYNSKVMGKSGRITWTSDTVLYGGYYQIRTRLTVLGSVSNVPTATHIQTNVDGETGFDALAAVFSTLTLSIYRKRGDGTYGSLPTEMGLPYTQCILYRNLAITDLPCWSDTKIGIKLSATPTANITIPYTGFIETIEP